MVGLFLCPSLKNVEHNGSNAENEGFVIFLRRLKHENLSSFESIQLLKHAEISQEKLKRLIVIKIAQIG